MSLQSQIKEITKQLVENYKPEKIILFGSAVTGNFTADSDLDFLIIKDVEKSFHDRVVEVYRLIKKDVAADFMVLTPRELGEKLEQGDPFVKAVLASGKVLYG